MSDIPAELRHLWAQRDRTEITVPSRPVLMDFRDDDSFWNDNAESVNDANPLLNRQPEPQNVRPIPDMKLFPVCQIGPPPINLATFHVKTQRD